MNRKKKEEEGEEGPESVRALEEVSLNPVPCFLSVCENASLFSHFLTYSLALATMLPSLNKTVPPSGE